jgi:hypothetical protein
MTDTDPRSLGKTLVPAAIVVIIVAVVFSPGGGLSLAKSDRAPVEYTTEYACGYEPADNPTCTADVQVQDLGDATHVTVRGVDSATYRTSTYTIPDTGPGNEGRALVGHDGIGDLRKGDYVIIVATTPRATYTLEEHRFSCGDSFRGDCTEETG